MKYSLLNQRFVKLLVIEELGGGKCKCKCDCGTVCVVRKHLLKFGKRICCGCLSKTKTMGETIECRTCGKTKSKDQFSKTKDGYRLTQCKECARPGYREKKKRRLKKYKYDALSNYGGKPPRCACCGEDRYEFLTLDHIDGGGNRHRRELKCGHKIYTWMKQNNYPKGFRVLCMNCNFAIGIHKNCPHKVVREETPAERVFNYAINNLISIKKIIYSDEFAKIIELLVAHRSWITGMGKCALVAQKMAFTLACNNTQAIFLEAGHALHGNLGVVQPNDLVVAFSNSGKTEEIIQIVQKIKEKPIKFVLITGSRKSILGDFADVVLDYGEIKEACLLGLTPTTSFVVMSVIADAIAMTIQKKVNVSFQDYSWNHHLGYSGGIAKSKVR